MANLMKVFQTTTVADPPNAGAAGAAGAPTKGMSDFLTVASFANFSAMTGAISMSWQALQQVDSVIFAAKWVPLALSLLWGVISVVSSLEGIRDQAAGKKITGSALLSPLFLAFLNSLVLTSAVIGATTVITGK